MADKSGGMGQRAWNEEDLPSPQSRIVQFEVKPVENAFRLGYSGLLALKYHLFLRMVEDVRSHGTLPVLTAGNTSILISMSTGV